MARLDVPQLRRQTHTARALSSPPLEAVIWPGELNTYTTRIFGRERERPDPAIQRILHRFHRVSHSSVQGLRYCLYIFAKKSLNVLKEVLPMPQCLRTNQRLPCYIKFHFTSRASMQS